MERNQLGGSQEPAGRESRRTSQTPTKEEGSFPLSSLAPSYCSMMNPCCCFCFVLLWRHSFVLPWTLALIVVLYYRQAASI